MSPEFDLYLILSPHLWHALGSGADHQWCSGESLRETPTRETSLASPYESVHQSLIRGHVGSLLAVSDLSDAEAPDHPHLLATIPSATKLYH